MRNLFRTDSDLQAYLNRARAGWRSDPAGDSKDAGTLKPGPPTSDEPESVLQGKIVRWAKDHGYPCQCFRQSRKARGFLVPGWFD